MGNCSSQQKNAKKMKTKSDTDYDRNKENELE